MRFIQVLYPSQGGFPQPAILDHYYPHLEEAFESNIFHKHGEMWFARVLKSFQNLTFSEKLIWLLKSGSTKGYPEYSVAAPAPLSRLAVRYHVQD